MTIARVALPVAAPSPFDYWVPAGLAVERGSLVRVRLARRELVGVVVAIAATSGVASERLQPVGELVAELPALSEDLLELARFVAGYYQEPLGLALAQMVPPLGPSRGGAPRASAVGPRDRIAPPAPPNGDAVIALNADQRTAAAAIVAAQGRYAAFALDGITGSGKTEVYLAAAAACIAQGWQALLLVPEINLTPQLEARVARALPGRCAVTLHSRLPAGARRRAWRAAAAGEPDLVLGTRLAVFAPMPRLGLVVVDEEHDPSFKQQEGVRYHGRDVAVWRARQRGVPVVLGSATPSLETLHQVERNRYERLRLPMRAVDAAAPPQVAFAPNREATAHDGIGTRLSEALSLRQRRGEQSLVFINRRGYAPSLMCAACGWQAGCRSCSARLVVHRDAGLLRCHHCGLAERLPLACPECGNVDLVPRGSGTQRLERSLASLFPAARIARIDRDTTRPRGAFAEVRERMDAGEVNILVGTQMLAKGHDFPRLTLVGVLGADNALYSADFRATERLAALLFQVAGRAGRAALPGEVIVQTDFPDHPLYRALAGNDYGAFAATLLAERRVAGLPPFAHLALVTAEAPRRDVVDAFLAEVRVAGRALLRRADGIEVFPPVPATLARRAGMERGQVLAQSADRAALQRFLPQWRSAIDALPSRRVRWAFDVDPPGFA